MVVIANNTRNQKIFKKAGRLPAVIISLSEYEDMKENLDMFYSENLMRDIEKARREVRNKKTISLKEAKRKLALK